MAAFAQQRDLFSRRTRKPPPATEFSLHVMVADVLERWTQLDWRYTHIASGELRDKVTAARLKRMGVKPGWPDFILLAPWGRVHFLELKRRGRTLSDAQDEFATWCAGHEIPFACCYNFTAALQQLKDWGVLRVGVTA